MVQENNLTRPLNATLLLTNICVGAGIALALIALFVLPVEGREEWGSLWKLRPMVVVPIAGAIGGACVYFLRYLATGNGWKVLATVFGVIVYIFGLWMGTVLGLVGTLWN